MSRVPHAPDTIFLNFIKFMTTKTLIIFARFVTISVMALLLAACATTQADKSLAETAADTGSLTCSQIKAENAKLDKAAEDNISDNSTDGARNRMRAISPFEVPFYMLKFRQINDQISEKRKALDASASSKNCGSVAAPVATKSAPSATAVKELPPTLKAPTGRVAKMTMAEIQKKLVDTGYLRAKPDGVFGKNTSDALKKFQQESGLEPTGTPDSETMERLASR